jgi:hypothetical protein
LSFNNHFLWWSLDLHEGNLLAEFSWFLDLQLFKREIQIAKDLVDSQTREWVPSLELNLKLILANMDKFILEHV